MEHRNAVARLGTGIATCWDFPVAFFVWGHPHRGGGLGFAERHLIAVVRGRGGFKCTWMRGHVDGGLVEIGVWVLISVSTLVGFVA